MKWLHETLSEISAIALRILVLTQSATVAALVAGISLSSPAQAFEVNNRWNTTAADGNTGPQGNPITLTWGLVADGTTISGSEGSSGSNLISFLDTQIGAGPGGSNLTLRPWYPIFNDVSCGSARSRV